jgi:hypothetical protein
LGSTIDEGQQQLLLAGLSCLPSSLTSLVLPPLAPLSTALLRAVARSCPALRALQARLLAPVTAAAAIAAAAAPPPPPTGVCSAGGLQRPAAAINCTALSGLRQLQDLDLQLLPPPPQQHPAAVTDDDDAGASVVAVTLSVTALPAQLTRLALGGPGLLLLHSGAAALLPTTDRDRSCGDTTNTSTDNSDTTSSDDGGSSSSGSMATNNTRRGAAGPPLPLPALTSLSLVGCGVQQEALLELLDAARCSLVSLALLQLRVQRCCGGAVVWGPLGADAVCALPVPWPLLQEWSMTPAHLWALVRNGRCSPAPTQMTHADAAGQPAATGCGCSSGSCATCWQQRGSALLPPSLQPQPQPLLHVSQLLSLRRLLVAEEDPLLLLQRGTSQQVQATLERGVRQQGDLPVLLPLHDAAALATLLRDLRGGVASLPALRELLLSLGRVAPEQSHAPLVPGCRGDLWLEFGEELLRVLPACRVWHCVPDVLDDATATLASSTAGMRRESAT